jgi:hypothetical protein
MCHSSVQRPAPGWPRSDLSLWRRNQERSILDIDKSWHLIHFLLTGDVWGGEPPLANVVLGGTELPDTDAGYGPFRYLTHKQVCETSQALSRITPAELWGRFNGDRVRAAEINPTPWAGDDGDTQYVTQNYESLRRFFAEAASYGKSLLLYLS